MRSRPACPALRPFVQTLWASDAGAPAAARERVLPTGTAHLAFRLSAPLRVFRDEADTTGVSVGQAILGGPRDSFYVRDVSCPSASVGAQLRPGMGALLLGAPADAIAGRHTPLEDVWGKDAARALERLAAAASPAARIDLLEAILLARLPRIRGVHPAVAAALGRLSADPAAEVSEIVEASGVSHRHFIQVFRAAVGLSPKVFARVQRFQRAIAQLTAPRAPAAATIALDAGYADQPHFGREFRAMSGLTPSRYRARIPAASNHVPIDGED